MKSRKPKVKIINKKNTYIGEGVTFGENVTIYEGNHIDGDTYIGDGTILLPNNFIVSSNIGENCKVHASVIENGKIDANASIGPYARIRPGTEIQENVKIGNFCEIKNSKIGANTKISHLVYVGDSEVGKNCNIGCGTIFVNYNGKSKSKTIVGDNCFIGSNCNLIAPLKIADNVYICAGTTVVNDCSDGSFIIGRVRAEEKPGKAKDYLKGAE